MSEFVAEGPKKSATPITDRIKRPENQLPVEEPPEEKADRLKYTPPSPADLLKGIRGPGTALPVEHKEEEKPSNG